MKTIIMYATDKNGDGFVQRVGEFESIEDVQFRCGMFADDVVISFEVEEDDKIDE